MKLIGKFTFLRALVLLTGVVALSSGLADAQSGTFRLPVEAKWGKATLPAGDYRYSMDPTTDKILTIRSMADGSGIMVLASSISQKQFARNQLILTKRGDQMFVTSLGMEDYGMVLNYAIPAQGETSSAKLGVKGQATLASASAR
jgi:hypothetical protein